MRLSVISFTQNGMTLAGKIARVLEGMEVTLFTKCSQCSQETMDRDDIPMHEHKLLLGETFVEEPIGEWAKHQMEEKKALLFIGACGIAVRAIAPYITNKLQDSPVLVMDEKGEYVIPILSGHVGGANELAYLISRKTGAVPVITTATDINGKFAVDLFAKKNELHIVNRCGIAKVSSKVLAGKRITLSIEPEHFKAACRIPEGIQIVPFPPKQSVDIVVTTRDQDFDGAILLKPREYVIGMGCRKGKELEKIEAFIQRSMVEAGIDKTQLLALASIEQKKEEQGLLAWSRKHNIPFITYTAEELQKVKGSFHSSVFVEGKVGVDNVCERAALKICEPHGELIYEKHAEDGMTIAIAKREWSVVFDEE